MRCIILCACVLVSTQAQAYIPNNTSSFGVYSKAYTDRQQAKRWRWLCRGAGRYQAMSEAYEAGKRDPCNSR
jgi:hypothetical protein